jgi:hypothetical protein
LALIGDANAGCAPAFLRNGAATCSAALSNMIPHSISAQLKKRGGSGKRREAPRPGLPGTCSFAKPGKLKLPPTCKNGFRPPGCSPPLMSEYRPRMASVQSRNVVFVVDDDAGMLQSVARLLRQFGYASLLSPSADAFESHHDFEGAVCVLLEINLGNASGIELRHHLIAASLCRSST